MFFSDPFWECVFISTAYFKLAQGCQIRSVGVQISYEIFDNVLLFLSVEFVASRFYLFALTWWERMGSVTLLSIDYLVFCRFLSSLHRFTI